MKNLSSTEDAFEIALKVFDILLDSVDVNLENPQEQEGQDEDGESPEGGEG